jgi:hypothetical protein
MLQQQALLRDHLRNWRGRLRPDDVCLPSRGRRRVPGLRSTEVAELAEVSAGWYEQFESGNSRRSFSPAFVQRVAAALRLTDEEQATLFRLALPQVATAARVFEANVRDGVARYMGQARDFARRLVAASSFEEASRVVVESTQAIVAPTCVTIASIQNGTGGPFTIAIGPRERFVGPSIAQCMLDMNDTVRGGAVVLCEDSPHPHSVKHDAAHPVRILTSDGHETDGMHDIAAKTYVAYNRRLLQRSEVVTGLFENGACRGVMSCSWTEPRSHLPSEIASIETLVAMLVLIAAPSIA